MGVVRHSLDRPAPNSCGSGRSEHGHAGSNMTELLKDLITIPEHVHKGDYVLKLTEGVGESLPCRLV